MNLASCSFPMSPARGPRRGKRPFCTISTNRIESPPSVLWLFLHNEDTWPSISNTERATSTVWTSATSSHTCSDRSQAPSSFSGIGERSTDAKKSHDGFLHIHGFMWNPFRRTRQNSTRLNMFGIKPITGYTISLRRILPSLEECFATPYEGRAGLRSSFGRASMLLTCHGDGEYFHYLRKLQ